MTPRLVAGRSFPLGESLTAVTANQTDEGHAYLKHYEQVRRADGAAAAIRATLARAAAPGGLRLAPRKKLACDLVVAEVERSRPLERATLAAICEAAPADLVSEMRATLEVHWPAFVDEWALEAVLGRGGFGTVYRARRETPAGPEVVALKWLHPQIEPESPLLAPPSHERLLVPRWQQAADGTHYGLMRFVDGESLSDLITRLRSTDAILPVREALRLVRDTAELVQHIHRRAYHRDLKPANVLVDTQGVVYLADFGLALARELRQWEADYPERAGTTPYQAPEVLMRIQAAPVVDGKIIDGAAPQPWLTAAADVWALGVLLYELLTGELPFGRDDRGVPRNALAGRYDSVRVRRADVPVAVDDMCARCLVREPAERMRSARDLVVAIERVLESLTPPSLPPGFEARYGGSDSAPAPFGGRTAELASLHEWLKTGSEPCALLTAPMGRGKSALLYHFVAEVRRAGTWDVIFVPISLLAGSASPAVFLRDLARHLAVRQERDLPTQADVLEWTRLWQEGLQAEHARGRALLVVVDGLDEALEGWVPDASFLPVPPTGSAVRILAAARDAEDGARWRQQLGWTALAQARRLTLGRLDGAGLLAVFARVGQPLDALPDVAAWRAALLRVTEGEPLVARLYAVEMWQGQKQTPRVPLTLAALDARAPGLTGYVAEWWAHQQRLWGGRGTAEEQRAREVLDLLAVAQGPLTVDDLAAVRGTGPGPVRDALTAAQRFLVGQGTEASPVALGHPRLTEFFTERLQVPAPEVHARFVRWGQRIVEMLTASALAPSAVPRYLPNALRHHLATAQAPLPAYDALLALPWVDASLQVTGSYDAVLSDIAAAQEALITASADDEGPGTPRELIRLVRSALIAGSIRGQEQQIPVALAVRAWETGHWSLARVLAHLDGRIDANVADTAAAAIAHAVAEVGEAALNRALGLRLSPVVTAHLMRALERVAPECVEGEGSPLARVIGLHDELGRAKVLESLACHLSAAWLPQLLAAVEALKDESGHARVLVTLASRWPETMLRQALAAVEAVKATEERADLLVALVSCRPHELLLRALAAVKTLKGEWRQERILRALVSHVPEALQLEALAAVEALKNERLLTDWLTALAPRWPEALLPRALAVVEALKDQTARARVMVRLARRWPEALQSLALAEVEALPEDLGRAQMLVDLAPHGPQKLLQKALAAVDAVSDEVTRSNMLVTLARHFPQVQPQALDYLRAVKNDSLRAHLRVKLAPHLPNGLLREGNVGEALAAWATVSDEQWRIEALSVLEPLIAAGSLPGLLAASAAIPDDLARIRLLVALAPHFPEEVEPLLRDVIEAVEDNKIRVQHLVALAPHLSEALTTRALAAVEAVTDDGTRAQVLADLAPHVATALLPQALASVSALRDEDALAEVLVALARHRPEALLPQALTAAAGLKDRDARVAALLVLAPQLTEALLPQALAAVEALQDDEARAQVIAALVPRMTDQLLERALAAAMTMKYYPARANLLNALVPQLTEEQLQEALAAVVASEDGWRRAGDLVVLAPYLTEALLPKVLDAVEALENEWQANVLLALARRWPEALLLRVLKLVEALKDETERAQMLADLAPLLTEALLPQALDVVDALEDEGRWALVLVALAPKLAEELLRRALEAVEALENEWARVQVLVALAPHLPQAMLPRALTAVKALDNEWPRAQVLTALALRWPQALLPQALAAAAALQDLHARHLELTALAPQLTEALLLQALAAADVLQSEWQRAEVMVALAPQMTESSLPRALAAVAAMHDPMARARVLVAIARRWPEAQRPALAAVEAVEYDEVRAELLVALAPKLAEALVPQALIAAANLHDEEARARVLFSLSPQLSAAWITVGGKVRMLFTQWLMRPLKRSALGRHGLQSNFRSILQVLPLLTVRFPGRVGLLTQALQQVGLNGRVPVLAWVQWLAAPESVWRLTAAEASALADMIDEVGRQWP